MPDLFNMNLPTIGQKGTLDQRVKALESYLTQLTEQMRFTLANLDPETNFSSTALKVYSTTTKGEKGAPGKSAYKYATEHGYTGTEDEFGAALAEVVAMQEMIRNIQKEIDDIKESLLEVEEKVGVLEQSDADKSVQLETLTTEIEGIKALLNGPE